LAITPFFEAFLGDQPGLSSARDSQIQNRGGGPTLKVLSLLAQYLGPIRADCKKYAILIASSIRGQDIRSHSAGNRYPDE
jgi:hypothetical protein